MTTTLRSDDELDRCSTCDNTLRWHRENNPSHPFNDGTLPASATFGKRRTDGQGNAPTPDVIPQTSAWPFDPVLRQALMDKGVLVPQDLRDAEEKIRATTAIVQLHPEGFTATTTGGVTGSFVAEGSAWVGNPGGGDNGPQSTT